MGGDAAHAATGAARTLDVLVPGLLGPVPIAPEDVPAVPVLERLFALGSRLAGQATNLAQSLVDAFGATLAGDRRDDPPSAPFCYLADDPDGDQGGYRLHADPVHLRLDRDRLLLYDARHLDLTQSEADVFIGLFNTHFRSQGLALEAPVPGRWYLRAAQPPRLRTWPLDAVVGRGIAPFLPTGEDARPWAALINEAQMLFARAEPNLRREATGKLPVSGIWPWGGGALSDLQPRARYRAVFADDPLAAGLARRAGAALHPLRGVEPGLTEAAALAPVLVVWDRLWPAVLDADAKRWAMEVVRLEDWLVRLQGLLRAGDLHRWTLDACGAGRWQLARRDAWRLWRRVTPLSAMLTVAGDQREP